MMAMAMAIGCLEEEQMFKDVSEKMMDIEFWLKCIIH
jgi:hypothetical protein